MSPNTRAVSEILPLVRRSMAPMTSRSTSSTAAARFLGFVGRLTDPLPFDGAPRDGAERSAERLSGSIVPPCGLIATARWTSFLNWRTLPGHQDPIEQVECRRTQMHVRFAEPLARFAEEVGAQVGNLLAPFAEWRHMDPDHAEAV